MYIELRQETNICELFAAAAVFYNYLNGVEQGFSLCYLFCVHCTGYYFKLCTLFHQENDICVYVVCVYGYNFCIDQITLNVFVHGFRRTGLDLLKTSISSSAITYLPMTFLQLVCKSDIVDNVFLFSQMFTTAKKTQQYNTIRTQS